MTDKMYVLTTSGQLIRSNVESQDKLNSVDIDVLSSTNNVSGSKVRTSLDNEKRVAPQDTRQMDFIFIDMINDDLFTDGDVAYDNVRKDKKELKSRKGRLEYIKDSNVSKDALRKAKYRCEYNKAHKVFKRKTQPHITYTEPHHLIPLKAYHDFDSSLDILQNICSLCSSCHNCLHYGSADERDIILWKLYKERKRILAKCGLEISFADLTRYY
jgi:glycerol-3-phosphate cytidylyltransferase-like family protein